MQRPEGRGVRGRRSPGPAQARTPHAGQGSPAAAVWTAAQWGEAVAHLLAELAPLLPAAARADDRVPTRLAAYMGLLAHWNATFNLTALRDPQDMLSHHLADCLVVLAPLQARLSQQGQAATGAGLKLLDVGSGGGLPGVILAICCPDLQVSCVDTVGKKAAFIRQVAAELQLPNLRGEHARVEQLPGQYDVITSRAFASLADFVRLSRNQLTPGGVWMAMKGKQPDDERAALPDDIDVFHVEQLQVPGLDAERCLVWMRVKP